MEISRTINQPGSKSRSRARHVWLKLLQATLVLWFLRSLALILWEYRFYFPLDFHQSSFLLGRESQLPAIYWPAFYTHLLVAPLTFVLGAVLYFSTWLKLTSLMHRGLGQIQWIMIVLFLTPSSLVMAWYSRGGVWSGSGLAILAALTALSITLAAIHARRREYQTHRYWATVCWLCLLSTFVLRMIMGLLYAVDAESITAYRVLAWGSWLLPILAYDLNRRLGLRKPVRATAGIPFNRWRYEKSI